MAGINFAQWNSEVLRPKQLELGQREYPSLALPFIANILRTTSRATVVDLGPARESTFRFLTTFQCKVYVEDLIGQLPEKKGQPLPLEQLQPYSERVNVILAWDLFNYLNQAEGVRLVRHLTPFCAKGCLLFCVNSTVSYVSDKPMSLMILNERSISYEIKSPNPTPCTPISHHDVQKNLAQWSLVRSLHLRNSMQENLFCFDRANT